MKTIKAAIKQRPGEPTGVTSPLPSQAISRTSRPRQDRRSRPSRALASRIKPLEAEAEDFTEELAAADQEADDEDSTDEENADDQDAMDANDVAAAGPSTSNGSRPTGRSRAEMGRVSSKTPADRKAVEHRHLQNLQVCSAKLCAGQ